MKSQDKNRIIADHGCWLEIDVSTRKFPDAIMKVDKGTWTFFRTIHCGRVTACSNKRPRYLYACFSEQGKLIRFHRFVIETQVLVDHINHDGLDNRISNLRAATPSENASNHHMYKGTTSGHTGVHKHGRSWHANITKNYKTIELGIFNKKGDAIRAREEGERKLFGAFAPKKRRQLETST